MSLRSNPYFKEGEQLSFSPVHNASHTLQRWAYRWGPVYSTSDHDASKRIYSLEDLRDGIDRDIETEGADAGSTGFTNDQLADIKRQIVAIYDHGSQYGIEYIQFANT